MVKQLQKDPRTCDQLRNARCWCGSGKKYKKCCWSDYNIAKTVTPKTAKAMIKDMRYRIKQDMKETGVCPDL